MRVELSGFWRQTIDCKRSYKKYTSTYFKLETKPNFLNAVPFVLVTAKLLETKFRINLLNFFPTKVVLPYYCDTYCFAG